jgi:TDG/mug DNA glycosylase family protein
MSDNKSITPWKPTKQQVAAAHGKRIPDVIGEGLSVLFVGINPSLYSAAVGHHFARPGNRFWPALHRGGFMPQQLSPFEDQSLLDCRMGLTNLVARATARADELSDDELRRGASRLRAKLRRWRPKCVAFVGISAFRIAMNQKRAGVGQQDEGLCDCVVWILPNPSGLNAHYQLDDFGRLFAELRKSVNAQ